MPDDQADDYDEPIPSVAAIAKWLRDLMTIGIRAARPEEVGDLLRLHAVRRIALVDQAGSRLAALHALIQQVIGGLEREPLRRLAPYAFGTYTMDHRTLEQRLADAKSTGHFTWKPDTMRKKPLDDLAAAIAERLRWLEERVRFNRWLGRPYDEAIHDQTLRQYDFLSAIAFWLNGTALDIRAALDERRSGQHEGFEEWAYSALWRWTRFLRVSSRFSVEFQGVWATLNLESEEQREAMRAEHDAWAVPPLYPRERSWLQVELLSALQEELAPFVEIVKREAVGRQILRKWLDWLETCSCSEGRPRRECDVHRFLDEAGRVFDAVNKEVGEAHWIDRAARFQTLPDIYEP
jgi:hypothetical protein